MKECNHVEACELALEVTNNGFKCRLCGAMFIDILDDLKHMREETPYEVFLREQCSHLFDGRVKIGDKINIKRPPRYTS